MHKKTSKNPYITIELNIYQYKIFILDLNKKLESNLKILKKNEFNFKIDSVLSEIDNKDFGAITFPFYSNAIILMNYSKEEKCKNDYISILTHELSHTIIFLFEQVNLPILHDTSEAFCYALQYCLFEALDKIKFVKKGKQIKKIFVDHS